MAEALLSVANIETYYGPIVAIRGVSFSVPEGSIVTILGANGAGKTTILKTVSGVMDPQKGTVTFAGRQIQRLDPDRIMRLGLSHVPEGREMFPFLTIKDNLRPKMMLLDEPSLGLSPKLVRDIFEIILRVNRERGVSVLLVEQNAHMALSTADYGYVLETGRIVMEDSCARLLDKDDIKEFYLGMRDASIRGTRRWKRKKTWR